MQGGWQKIFIGLALTLVLAVVLVARYQPWARRQVTDAVTPFLEGPRARVGEDEALFRQSKVELIRRIRELEEQVAADRLTAARGPDTAAENAELRQLLGLEPPLSYRLVTAGILTRDPASGGRRLRLDRGSEDGLAPGQAVLADGVLLGRILEVAEHSAVVITLGDPECKISVCLPERDVHGILVGDGQSAFLADPHCRLQFLPRDLEYTAGEIVETSDFGRQVPGGLPVGELAALDDESVTELVDQLYRNATVRPYVFRRTYRHVGVLVNTMPPEVVHNR